MKVVLIRLSSAKQVQNFVDALVPLEGDFELIAYNFILDARSFMGIFALDLTKPLRLKIHNDSIENMMAIEPFRIDTENTDHEQ